MTFETKDSGKREEYGSGMRRDTASGKPRYDLIDRAMLKRDAELMARGAEKYGERNWELANSEEEAARFQASAFRHFMQWINGETDEDHAAATRFNIAAYEHVARKIRQYAALDATAELGSEDDIDLELCRQARSEGGKTRRLLSSIERLEGQDQLNEQASMGEEGE